MAWRPEIFAASDRIQTSEANHFVKYKENLL